MRACIYTRACAYIYIYIYIYIYTCSTSTRHQECSDYLQFKYTYMSTDPWSPVVQGHGEDSGVDKYVDEARSLAEQGLVTVSNNNIVLDESSPVELGLSAHATDKYPPPIRYNRLDMLTYHVIYRKEYELYPAYTDFMRADYNKTKATTRDNAMFPVSGVAGTPRPSSLRQPSTTTPGGRSTTPDQERRETPTKTQLRNSKRGSRSEEATARRKAQRSLKRNIARNLHRRTFHQPPGAPSRERRDRLPKFQLNEPYAVASVTIRGMKTKPK